MCTGTTKFQVDTSSISFMIIINSLIGSHLVNPHVGVKTSRGMLA